MGIKFDHIFTVFLAAVLLWFGASAFITEPSAQVILDNRIDPPIEYFFNMVVENRGKISGPTLVGEVDTGSSPKQAVVVTDGEKILITKMVGMGTPSDEVESTGFMVMKSIEIPQSILNDRWGPFGDSKYFTLIEMADINEDGHADIILSGNEYMGGYDELKLYAIDLVTGEDILRSAPIAAYSLKNLAVDDISSSHPGKEIAVMSRSSDPNGPSTLLTVFSSGSGEIIWQVSDADFVDSFQDGFPVIADINQDGIKDIIAVRNTGEYYGGTWKTVVSVYNQDPNNPGQGKEIMSWETDYETASSVSVAQLAGDAKLEIVVGLGKNIWGSFEEASFKIVALKVNDSSGLEVLWDSDRPLGADGPDVFVRGEVNGDGNIDISDAVCILFSLFGRDNTSSCYQLACQDAADTNDDGVLDISDAIRLLLYLFTDRVKTLPEPFPQAGIDPTPDGLGNDQAVSVGRIESPLVIGDVSGDGKLDIVYATSVNLMVLDGETGQLVRQHSRSATDYVNIALADLNRDGILEVAAQSYVYRVSGNELANLLIYYPNSSHEVVFSSMAQDVYPRNLDIADLDDNGTLEIVMTDRYILYNEEYTESYQSVVVNTLTASGSTVDAGKGVWTTKKGNLQRTGLAMKAEDYCLEGCPVCGDGIVSGWEQCEAPLDPVMSPTCQSLGFPSGGTLGCYPAGHPRQCTFDVTQCGVCGDMVINYLAGEQCDSTEVPLSCEDLGFNGGVLNCHIPGTEQECQFDTSTCFQSLCPDAICQADETHESCPEDCL